MPSSPTIDLALIIKNERKNLPRLFESVSGCMDAIHVTDTGSTDGSVEWIKEHGEEVAKCPVHVHLFDWVNDFAKARNYSFSKCTSDFVLWLDADDCLHNKQGFLHWKKSAMQFADFFLCTYNYALNQEGVSVCSFVRERVFRRSINPQWRYPIHEGIIMQPGWAPDRVPTNVWCVNHMRDADDIKADKSRNLTIFEDLKARGEQWDGRLQFYYAKELFEAQKPHESLNEFKLAVARRDVEQHDRILTYQYASYAAMACSDQIKDELKEEKKRFLDASIEFCHEGLKLDPNRAEFYVTLGDCYLKQGNLIAARPNYGAAKHCLNQRDSGSPYEGAIYSFLDCYGQNPSLQIARIDYHLGRIDEALKEAKECHEKYKSPDAESIVKEIERVKPLITLDNNQERTEDIVFSCPPGQAYPFDEEIYETKPLGGSETALVQMAKELKALTGRPVKVFNTRETDLIAKSGVEYISNRKLNEYMSKNKPYLHVAWRHNIKITNAKSLLYAHDLFTPGVEAGLNADKMTALSQFHKELTMGKCGVPEEKIFLTRNGITPEKFLFDRPAKNPNKFVYTSSPDRGLYGAILIVDEVRKVFPETTLDVYYGLGNLRKYGLVDLANKIEALLPSRPWVTVHDFTEQNQMYREIAEASIWLHPATFIETFAITAIEMLALGIYPVTRRLGALQNTLAEAEASGQATLLESNNLTHYITEPEIKAYADACITAVQMKKWKDVSLDLNAHSWSSIAAEWAKEFKL